MSDNWEPKVGSQLRIRLPNDYLTSHGPPINRIPEAESSPLTLEQYNDRVLSQTIRRFAECQAYETLARQSHLADLLFLGYKPPGKWRRRLDRLKRFPGRVRDAWNVLWERAYVDHDYD